MINKLFFDIETLPADEAASETLHYLFDRVRSKIEPADYERRNVADFESYFDATGLDGAFGRVLTIAYAINDGPLECLCNPSNEKETLEKFWELAGKSDMFIGHNIRDFDLVFLLQRSAILGVRPTWNRFQVPGQKPWEMTKFLDFARYKNAPIFDTMHEWSIWNGHKATLEHVALALGIPTPKVGIDGHEVDKFFKAGKLQDIIDYCKRDVETTRLIYKKMTFESLPKTESAPF